jgi:putative transposase
MPYDPQKHHRRSIRLKGYDYSSSGAYFVTICTRGRECVLDDPVVAGIITDVWYALPGWFPTIALDEFVVMPNHVHFVLWIRPPDDVGATLAVAQDTVAQAGASPAPTGRGGDVGATLAVACTTDTALGDDNVGATLAVAQEGETAPWTIPEPQKVNQNPTLGDVVGAFQSLVFAAYLDWIRANDPTRRAKFRQRNYYEHIIRNKHELQAIRRYIRLNPDNWALDRDNLDNIRRFSPPKAVEDYMREALAGGENGVG